jgi:2-polyprenyl-6-methoxyphenol hydroxylase-like FAD-dependent oxidoreductase
VHHERRFRIIVNVPPSVLNLSSTTEFRYGQIEGQAPTLEHFSDLVRQSMGEAFAEISEPTWLTYFMVQERMVEKLRAGRRMFLAGDAAHCHSPAGGQGMNMGIQDGIATVEWHSRSA